jgi:sulfur-oxidizing protein SoxB
MQFFQAVTCHGQSPSRERCAGHIRGQILAFALMVMTCLAQAGETPPTLSPGRPSVDNPQATTRVTLLHMGDIHGHLIPRPNLRSDGNGRPQGGLARLYTRITELRAANPHSLLINTGDTLQGSAEALFTEGGALVAVLNPFGIDAFAAGNWDFVYGTRRFVELFTGERPLAPWGALAANLYYAAGDYQGKTTAYADRAGQRVLPPFMIKEMGGVRIGIIGLTANRGPQAVAQATTSGLRFTDGERELADLLVQLRGQEAVAAVILISELGLAANRRLAERHPGIDVVLSSDMHELTREPILTPGGTLLVEEGQDGTVLGQIDLLFEAGVLKGRQWTLHTIDDRIAEDPTIAALIAAQRAPFVAGPAFTPHLNPINQSRLATPIDTVVGLTRIPLHRANFSHEVMPAVIEGSAHDFLADAFRAVGGADIGAIRGFRYGTQVAPGPIRLEDLYHFMPIGAQIAVGTIRGQDLVDQIEASADGALNPAIDRWTGGGLFGFSGVEIELSPYSPRGQRAVAVRVGDQPLDPRAPYRYAAYWYPGDPELINRLPAHGIRVLTTPEGAPLDATEVVVRYLRSLPDQTADPQLNRVRLTAPLPAPEFGFPVMQPLLGAYIPGVPATDLRIDIPVALKGSKIVINIGQADLEGDVPASISFMGKLARHLVEKGAAYRIVGIFKGDALYLLLQDSSYNRVRQVATGNPYREMLAALLRAGVEIEACGNAMETHHFGNADLLPGIRVNEGAMFRTAELVREGFVQLEP